MTLPFPEIQEEAATEESAAGELFAARYRLGPVLGHGSTAVVHQAFDERLRRSVALKVFRLDGGTAADPARHFVTEARLLARLHHPGLVEIFDYGHAPQGAYLALELISGPTLRELIAAGPMSFAETVRTGAVVARTLACIHAAGVIHRDVKPSNILIDEQGMPRLTDFGVSLVVDGAVTTQAGNIVGTAAYLAPEQVLGARANAAADVFALGLVLVECLTGRREYPGVPVEAAVARLHRLPTIPQGLPRGMSQALERMTAWNPAERPSAGECAAFLGTPVYPIPSPPEFAATPFGADDETAWVSPAVARPTAKRRSGRRMSAALAVAAVTAAVGVAVIAFSPDAESAAARTPAVVSRTGPTTAPGSASAATPAPQTSSAAPVKSSSPYTVLPSSRAASLVAVPKDNSTTKAKDHGKGHGHR